MPRFSYSAIDKTGGMTRGEISAPTDIDAMDQLARHGLTVASLEQGGSGVPWWQRDIALFGDANALKPREQAEFFKTLSSMLSSGFTLNRALSFTANQAKRAKPKSMFTAISDHVSSGGTLGTAMEETQGFQNRLIGLVHLGESANQLQVVSTSISEMLTVEMRNSQQIRQALIYPTILLLMSVLVILMLVFFLAPTLVPVFRTAGVTPPTLLNALDQLSLFMTRQWPLFLASIGLVIFAIIAFRKQVKSASSKILASLPGFKRFLIARETLNFMQTLHLMLESGATITGALGTAASTAASARWKKGIEDVRVRVEAGEAFSKALSESGLPDPTSLAFVEAGEESDQLAEMLRQAARQLDDQTRSQLDQALRLITPALTLLIGVTIGLLIFTTIGAILDLNDLAT